MNCKVQLSQCKQQHKLLCDWWCHLQTPYLGISLAMRQWAPAPTVCYLPAPSTTATNSPPSRLFCHTHLSSSSHPARSGCLHQWTPPPSQSLPPWTVETSALEFLQESETGGLKEKWGFMRRWWADLRWQSSVRRADGWDSRQKWADWQKQRERKERVWLQSGSVVEQPSGWRSSDSTRPHLQREGEKSAQNAVCCRWMEYRVGVLQESERSCPQDRCSCWQWWTPAPGPSQHGRRPSRGVGGQPGPGGCPFHLRGG